MSTSKIYSQCLSGDCNNGWGDFKYDNGTYSGNWKNGQKWGFGSKTYNNGDKYQGNWQEDKKSGQGTYEFADGSYYYGNWSQNEYSGNGIWVSGAVSYNGTWQNGLKSGQGTFVFFSGDKYVGEWMNDMMSGYGKYIYLNGNVNEGLFENGEFVKSVENLTLEDLGITEDESFIIEEDEINNEKVNSQRTGTSVVSRDNILYKTVTINGITWMAENLRSVTFRNGDNILEAKTKDDLIRYNNIKMPCYVKKLNTDANGIAGDLTYNWYAISDFRGLAPIGFHISTNSEWDNLIDYCGGPVSASTKLKSSSGYPITPSGEIEIMKACPNCKNWNSEYRSKVACPGCKDNRKVYDYTKKIPSINWNGSNALGFNWQYGSEYVSIDEESATHADGGFLDARGPLLFMGSVIRNQFSDGHNIMQVNVRCVKD